LALYGRGNYREGRILVGSCPSIFSKRSEDASCLPLYEEADKTKLQPY
jgi:hypothetical protein